jgi:ABC-2 type transport system permease protein
MGAQVKAEWIKARSLRSTWVIVGLSIVGVLAQAITALAGHGTHAAATTQDVMSGSGLTLVLMVVIGAMITATEYTQKSIISTYTANPNRLRVALAKAVVIVAIGLVVGAMSVPLSRLVAAIWFAFGSGSWDAGVGTAIHYAYGTMLAYAGFGILGVMIGLMARSTAIGVGVAFAAIFVVDPLLGAISLYSDYSLTGISNTLTDPNSHQTASQPAFGSAIALLALYVVVLGLIAIAIEETRDVD